MGKFISDSLLRSPLDGERMEFERFFIIASQGFTSDILEQMIEFENLISMKNYSMFNDTTLITKFSNNVTFYHRNRMYGFFSFARVLRILRQKRNNFVDGKVTFYYSQKLLKKLLIITEIKRTLKLANTSLSLALNSPLVTTDTIWFFLQVSIFLGNFDEALEHIYAKKQYNDTTISQLIRCIEASHKLKSKKLVINSLNFDGQQSLIELATLIQYELTNRRNIKLLNFLISMEKKSISIEIIIKYVICNSRLFWKYELINEIAEIRNKKSSFINYLQKYSITLISKKYF